MLKLFNAITLPEIIWYLGYIWDETPIIAFSTY